MNDNWSKVIKMKLKTTFTLIWFKASTTECYTATTRQNGSGETRHMQWKRTAPD